MPKRLSRQKDQKNLKDLKDQRQHPDHTGELPRLRRIIGQLEGVERMIRDRRYCPDIIQQLRAADSAVKALELQILKSHLNVCIRTSIKTDKVGFETKLKELLEMSRN